MKVAVIGAGNMGGGIAKGLVPRHDVFVGSRDAGRGADRAKELGAAGGGTYADAAADAEVVFLCVPWVKVDETLPQLGDMSGKVLVDITNAYVDGKLQPLEGSSNAEEIQKKAPGASLVKGWNTLFAAIVNDPDFGGGKPAVFLAGDDAGAKEKVATLARDSGLDPIDCGPLQKARDLEHLIGLLPALGTNLQFGRWALSLLTR